MEKEFKKKRDALPMVSISRGIEPTLIQHHVLLSNAGYRHTKNPAGTNCIQYAT